MKILQNYLSALREASVVYVPDEERPMWVITYEADVVEELGLVISLGSRLTAADDAPLFSVREVGRGIMRRKLLHQSSLGSLLASLFRVDFSRISQYYPRHTLHPFVSIVESAIADRALGGFDLRQAPLFCGDLVALVDRLNGCVADLRRQLRAGGTRRKADDFTRSARKNCASMKKYFSAILQAHGVAIVHRAELFFRDRLSLSNGTDQAGTDYKAARGYVNKLRGVLSELPEGYLLGHVLRLDNSTERGYVIHVVFLVNPGTFFEQAGGVIDFVNRKWSEITTGMGACYEYGNDIAFPQTSLKRCGTGLCYANNTESQRRLNDAAMYLSMLDSFVRLKVPGRDRTLWRGITPKIAKKIFPATNWAQGFSVSQWLSPNNWPTSTSSGI